MKGKPTSFASQPCPIARTVGIIGDPWSLLIVRDALMGATRFGEFQRSLGVAKNILSQRLRRLVAEGVLECRSAEGRRHRVYVPTEKGRQLRRALRALKDWGDAFVPRSQALP